MSSNPGAVTIAPYRNEAMRVLQLALACLLSVLILIAVGSPASANASAGVSWQTEVAGYGVTVTNPEWGWAGPKVGNNWHTNVHVFSRHSGYHQLLNLHASKYNTGDSTCFYGWDSVHNWTVYDFCYPNWAEWAGAAVAAGDLAWEIVQVGAPYILVPAAAL